MQIFRYLTFAALALGGFLLAPRALSANDTVAPGVWVTSHDKVDFGDKSLLDVWEMRAKGVGQITLQMVLYRDGKAQPLLANQYDWTKIPDSEQKCRLYFLRTLGSTAAFQIPFSSGGPDIKVTGAFNRQNTKWPASFPQQFWLSKNDEPYRPGKSYVLYVAASEIGVGKGELLPSTVIMSAENPVMEVEKFSRTHKGITLLALTFEWRKEAFQTAK